MGNGSGMTVNIDENLVQPIIKAEIQAAIVRQLEADKNLIPKMVQAALNEKVDREGRRSTYSSDPPYIEYLCNQAIRDAAKEGLKKYIEQSSDVLALEVEKQIRSQSKNIAKVFVEGMAGAIKTSWNFSVNVSMPQQ